VTLQPHAVGCARSHDTWTCAGEAELRAEVELHAEAELRAEAGEPEACEAAQRALARFREAYQAQAAEAHSVERGRRAVGGGRGHAQVRSCPSPPWSCRLMMICPCGPQLPRKCCCPFASGQTSSWEGACCHWPAAPRQAPGSEGACCHWPDTP